MIASSYPLLDVFWTMLWFFAFFLWIWLVVACLTDVFRSHDLSGWGKALWTLDIFVLPLLGVLFYLIVRGAKMHERDLQHAQAQDEALTARIQQAAGTGLSGSADELSKLADLRDRGVITEEEFQQEKTKLLAA